MLSEPALGKAENIALKASSHMDPCLHYTPVIANSSAAKPAVAMVESFRGTICLKNQ